MDKTINMALAASMEQISAHPVVRGHVGDKLGKLLKSTAAGAFIAAAMLSASPGAMAQNSINGGCVVGALAGGLLGHTAGGGNGKTALSAIGAVLGCNAGQQVQSNTEMRQQRPAGYPNANAGYPNANAGYSNANAGYPNQNGAPANYGGNYSGGYQAPVVGVHPMGNYMQHTFAQLNGQEQPSQTLTTQGRMAMDKALAEAERRMAENNDAQQGYAQAYQQLNQARMAGSNPEAQVLMGTQTLRNNQYQYEGNLNRAAQIRSQTNMNFGSAGMRLSDLAEHEAFNGYDVRAYGDRIQRVLSAPMSAPVTGFDPTTRQNVTFNTGVGMQQPSAQQPSYQQPSYQQRPAY